MRHHTVDFYKSVAEPAENVATYLTLGFRSGEGAIMIVRPQHWALIAESMARNGVNPPMLRQMGQVDVLDCASTLASVLEEGKPDYLKFVATIGPVAVRMRSK